jgi:hypothetical protein
MIGLMWLWIGQSKHGSELRFDKRLAVLRPAEMLLVT